MCIRRAPEYPTPFWKGVLCGALLVLFAIMILSALMRAECSDRPLTLTCYDVGPRVNP